MNGRPLKERLHWYWNDVPRPPLEAEPFERIWHPRESSGRLERAGVDPSMPGEWRCRTQKARSAFAVRITRARDREIVWWLERRPGTI